MSDRLDQLDANARLSLTVPGEIRAAWLQAAQAINDRDGNFGSGRIHRWLEEHDMGWAHSPNSGSTMTHLVRSHAAVWTGGHETLGNFAQRAGLREVKTYRLTRRVFPEATA